MEDQCRVEEQSPSLEETLHTVRRRVEVRAPAVGTAYLHTCSHHHNSFSPHHNTCSHSYNTSSHHLTNWSHHT